MILLIQRVSEASVRVEEDIVGKIGQGLLAFVAVEPGDDDATARRLVDRVVAYRVFSDEAGRMNLSLADTGGELLLVSQFTLAADTRKGLRPSFTTAAAPELGRKLFERVVEYARKALPGKVATGRFGAEMKVSLVNDGPVTFWLRFSAGTANES
ncbi:MAG: D-aminoacyl-tRNA deacylase [Steroidobacteraceae bacterium]